MFAGVFAPVFAPVFARVFAGSGGEVAGEATLPFAAVHVVAGGWAGEVSAREVEVVERGGLGICACRKTNSNNNILRNKTGLSFVEGGHTSTFRGGRESAP